MSILTKTPKYYSIIKEMAELGKTAMKNKIHATITEENIKKNMYFFS